MTTLTPDPPTFYMTTLPRDPVRDIAVDLEAPVMENAVYYHSETNGFRTRDAPPTRWVIDSGGYTAMDQFGGTFPWTVREYHEFLAEMYDERQFDWAAVMDFACEEQFDDILTVDERVDKTIENTIAHFNLDPEYPVFPVLQGRTINDYLECYDRLCDHGIPTDYVGLGTVCRLSSTDELREIETAVRANTDIKSLHGFGVKLSSFTTGATFDTADSKAWSWKLMFGKAYEIAGTDQKGHPRMSSYEYGGEENAEQAKRKSFRAYYKRAAALQADAYCGDTTPTALAEFTTD